MKMILGFAIPLVALVVLLAFIAPWPVAAAFAGAGVLIFCLGSTWYFADDEPVLGPKTDTRVTFKTVLLNFFADVAELAHLKQLWGLAKRHWQFWSPWLTNTILQVVVAFDAFLVTQPAIMDAIQETRWGWLIIFALHFVAARAVVALNQIPPPAAA
jgi:hypothetical protein